MAKQVALNHRTHYRYNRPVTLGPQLVQLRPSSHCRTPILSYSLKVAPSQHLIRWQHDPYNNHVARLIFPEKTAEFGIEVDLVADLSVINPFDFFLDPRAEEYPFTYSPELAKDLGPYLSLDAGGRLFQDFIATMFGKRCATVDFLLELNRRVTNEIGYVTRLEPGILTLEQILESRTGSCRDSSWLLIQTLRHFGIAARFVSGYLIQLATCDQSTAPLTDSADLHAWVEAFLPGAGWIGLDPTSGLLAGEGHIPLACTPTAAMAAPIAGTVEPAKVDFAYCITVRRCDAPLCLTQPLGDQEWQRVEQLARKVDTHLLAHDVRLTMGSEPTFVSIDSPESAQWSIDALGPMKRTRGLTLIRRLSEKIAPGALLHYGQGKWYPGEALPRWALSCYWRADRVPIWENPDFIALEEPEPSIDTADALRYIDSLARRLQVSSKNILPACSTGEASEKPAGYVLPLRRRQYEGHVYWSSEPWFPRPQPLLLLPGDSSIGYRLPVEALPWVSPDEVAYEYEATPFGNLVKLPSLPVRRMDLFDLKPAEDPLPPIHPVEGSAKEKIRPALCVETREGHLQIFLPYASNLADYLDLLAAVEDTCRYLPTPVWVQGYPPPADPRLRSFSVTPDPGVLEVNLPPAENWEELEQTNKLVFKEARALRLTTGKFSYDGRDNSTGGGNHIVIGGRTVSESPLLRRPDLLRSMVTFWQNHPSLSFLFSGMFVGPTSQYPRVDEARTDALYELEIAFSQLADHNCAPEVIDGLFRNLLVDVTGNTHRAEFCIDKLYPPEGLGLRLGLLELRAFEMAPDEKMVLLEMLLIRALISMFWRQPFTGKLVRWGTNLHDRFLLPSFAQHDLFDILEILDTFGYRFDKKWFDAHLEFRFPRIGSIGAQGLELELRHAIEPWPVLAEETTSGGAVRRVDSSLERLQVRVSGLPTQSRYFVTCNGRKVTLHPTANTGEGVAGVRYRARKLSSTMYPTIPVHTPLDFELIDSWSQRSIGRCRYHSVRPDGSEYSTRPTDAAEAERRRQERFEDLGAGIKQRKPFLDEEPNPSFPMTLDLRWPARTRAQDLSQPEDRR